MLKCKEVTALASEALERKLTWHERVGIRLHLMMCKLCSRYVRQLHVLHDASRHLAERSAEQEGGRQLSAAARERIRKRLG
jgi:hypothetical protein